jgi:hypothetical protein
MTTYGAVAPASRIGIADVARPASRRTLNLFGRIRAALASSIERSRQADLLAGCGASAEIGRSTGISC